jgi:hypothetical protein
LIGLTGIVALICVEEIPVTLIAVCTWPLATPVIVTVDPPLVFVVRKFWPVMVMFKAEQFEEQPDAELGEIDETVGAGLAAP